MDTPSLPYAHDALEPHISEKTLSFHFDKHHMGYYGKLVAAAEGSEWATASLEDIMTSGPASMFNNAAQTWNHTFYWNSMSPNGGGAPSGDLAAAIDAAFGSLEAFKEQFNAAAGGQFGSGWAWLVKDADGHLSITTTGNAGCPLTEGVTPILTCDVWEHAYYLDYQNARPAYLAAWWNVVNWDFASANFA
jgi:Fe-Mn family superoxide dismutase